ncbi:MFS transporter [Alicyclobacillus dauci]|uniref:MFS transporter n=1 Tax=Alicyclobacillus dauci TaxID=1475485 RepID=A0ABY6Z3A6_9BACL|nr:MFS transporter [Alicyclobacillus dauci]WAH37239.1 MFS transporter [Alicyclobacillus dauci]
MQRLWTRDFVFVALSTFFVFFNLQMITPALSSYISAGIGGNNLIGLSNAVWAVSGVVTRTILGKVLMTANKRRLLWMAMAVYLVATILYVFADSIVMLFIVRVLYGIGFGLTTTTLGTLAADVIPPARLGEGMGYFGLSTSLAMALAPLVGIGVYNGFGFRALIYLTTAMMLVVSVIVPFIRGRENSRRIVKQTRARLRVDDFYDHAVFIPCILLLLLSITYGGLVSFITLYGAQIHVANVGWFFLIEAGAIVLVRPISGKLYDRHGHIAVIPIGALFAFVGLLLLSYASNLGLFFASGLFYGLGYGVLQPALQAWLFQRLSPEKRGIGSGAFYSSVDLGIAVGSVLLGVVSNGTGYALMYRLASLCVLVLFLIYTVVGLRERRDKRMATGTM